MTQLQVFDVSTNRLSGTIASELFESKPQLQICFIGSNFFSGAVPKLGPSLVKVDFSDNAFTGTLPREHFNLPNLTSYSASVNCLSLRIPFTVCFSESLMELYLNGLSRSDKCGGDIVREDYSSYVDESH